MIGPRRAVTLTAVAALLVAGCTGDLPSVSPTCDNAAAMQLIAQAVPEAHRIPCLDAIPFGFEATTFDVAAGRANLRLSHQVLGRDVVLLTLAATCTSSEGQQVERADADRPALRDTPAGGVAGRITHDLGACLLVEFHLDHPEGQRVLDEFTSALQLLDRPVAQPAAGQRRRTGAADHRSEAGTSGNGAGSMVLSGVTVT